MSTGSVRARGSPPSAPHSWRSRRIVLRTPLRGSRSSSDHRDRDRGGGDLGAPSRAACPPYETGSARGVVRRTAPPERGTPPSGAHDGTPSACHPAGSRSAASSTACHPAGSRSAASSTACHPAGSRSAASSTASRSASESLWDPADARAPRPAVAPPHRAPVPVAAAGQSDPLWGLRVALRLTGPLRAAICGASVVHPWAGESWPPPAGDAVPEVLLSKKSRGPFAGARVVGRVAKRDSRGVAKRTSQGVVVVVTVRVRDASCSVVVKVDRVEPGQRALCAGGPPRRALRQAYAERSLAVCDAYMDALAAREASRLLEEGASPHFAALYASGLSRVRRRAGRTRPPESVLLWMEHLDASIASVLRRSPDARLWWSAIAQVVAALAAASLRLGAVHNDLHSGNVRHRRVRPHAVLYYRIAPGRYLAVPTWGRLYVLIDWGRASFRLPPPVAAAADPRVPPTPPHAATRFPTPARTPAPTPVPISALDSAATATPTATPTHTPTPARTPMQRAWPPERLTSDVFAAGGSCANLVPDNPSIDLVRLAMSLDEELDVVEPPEERDALRAVLREWCTTDDGRDLLAELDDVDDDHFSYVLDTLPRLACHRADPLRQLPLLDALYGTDVPPPPGTPCYSLLP